MTGSALAVPPDQVIVWVNAGVSEAEIIARLRADRAPAAIGAHEVLRLKAAGVSDAVLAVLIEVAPAPLAPEPTEPAPPVASETPKAPAIKTVDDIIAAHRAGKSVSELTTAVRGLGLKMRPEDRKRLRAAGVPDEVILAAATRKAPRAPAKVPAAAMAQGYAAPDGFAESTTVLVELGGGFESLTVGDSDAITALRLAPSLLVMLESIAVLGVEAEVVVTPRAELGNVFATAGIAVPLGSERTFLLRLVGRAGVTKAAETGPVYGFALAGLGRSGALIAGVGLTANWSGGEPPVSRIALDLRIGTWF